MISDRELIKGLFNMVGALAEQTTGKRLVVTMRDTNGDVRRVYASSYPNIDWIEAPDVPQVHAPASDPFPRQTFAPTPDDNPNQAHAIAK